MVFCLSLIVWYHSMHSVVFLYVCHILCYMRFLVSLCLGCIFFWWVMSWMLHCSMYVVSQIFSSLLSVVKHIRMWPVSCWSSMSYNMYLHILCVSVWCFLFFDYSHNVCGMSSHVCVTMYVEYFIMYVPQCMFSHSVPHTLWHSINLLCHIVCGISSEPVSAVADFRFLSVPHCIWHLLWTFLQPIAKNCEN